MKITKYLLTLSSVALMFASLTWGADGDKDKDRSDIEKRIDTSATVLKEIMATPDKAIPDSIMRDAKCVAVVPSMVKIAVGFGGNHGKGSSHVPDCARMERTAPFSITGGSWGLQLGGQAVDLVMIVTNDPRHAASALQPFQTWGRCFRSCWSCGTRYGG